MKGWVYFEKVTVGKIQGKDTCHDMHTRPRWRRVVSFKAEPLYFRCQMLILIAHCRDK